MANDEIVVVQDGTAEQSTDKSNNAGDQSEKQSQKLYDISGQQITADQLAESYKNLEKDYTKKSNELAQLKKPVTESTDSADDETQRAKEALKALGVVTDDELDARIEAREKAREEQSRQKGEMIQFFADNPHLVASREAIEALSKSESISPYDVATKYKFTSPDKLSRAKDGEPTGSMPQKVKAQPKAIRDMSPAEYAAWKQENLKGGIKFTRK